MTASGGRLFEGRRKMLLVPESGSRAERADWEENSETRFEVVEVLGGKDLDGFGVEILFNEC